MVAELDEGRTEPSETANWVGRLVVFLPAVAFLATFGFFFIDKNRQARTVLGSGRGLLAVAAIVLGYVAIAFLLRRLVRREWLPPIVLAVVVLGLAAWIVRPYYTHETANRELVTGPVRDASDTTSPGAAKTSAPQEAPAPGAVRVGAGRLQGIDHDAAGKVSLLRAEDGSLVVRFEDFDIEGTPDPQVYLAPGENVRDPAGDHLGRLTGNRGQALDIEVPEESEAEEGWTVLVWCGTFAVPVANATLTAT